MPHQCTSCGRGFPDGSKEMLSGCPDCGGNKFQFKPKGRTDDTTNASGAGDRSPSAPTDSSPGGSKTSKPIDQPTTKPSDVSSPATGDTSESGRDTSESGSSEPKPEVTSPSGSDTPDSATPDADGNADDSDRVDDGSSENTAQASARSDVVSPEELDRASRPTSSGDHDESTGAGDDDGESDERPGIDDLREELNDQFESIRIVSPGQYELNLMELYDRQEYIISLQEDGRYVIEMPDAWGVSDE